MWTPACRGESVATKSPLLCLVPAFIPKRCMCLQLRRSEQHLLAVGVDETREATCIDTPFLCCTWRDHLLSTLHEDVCMDSAMRGCLCDLGAEIIMPDGLCLSLWRTRTFSFMRRLVGQMFGQTVGRLLTSHLRSCCFSDPLPVCSHVRIAKTILMENRVESLRCFFGSRHEAVVLEDVKSCIEVPTHKHEDVFRRRFLHGKRHDILPRGCSRVLVAIPASP